MFPMKLLIPTTTSSRLSSLLFMQIVQMEVFLIVIWYNRRNPIVYVSKKNRIVQEVEEFMTEHNLGKWVPRKNKISPKRYLKTFYPIKHGLLQVAVFI